jgi:hypothetical protein
MGRERKLGSGETVRVSEMGGERVTTGCVNIDKWMG